ncbi:MAG: AraC family transcriptional regulator [Deltaproteobacteria bacterium]|nr:AraC family transcriptional regulator [Deltaproteobacteria bacterium]
MNCHYVGPMRRLFLEAKALELLICSVREFFGQPSDTVRKSAAVCRRDADKAHEAADLLIKDFYSVPSMDDLSRAVGMSRSKLNHVFKEVHGTTPFAFLRNHRLAKARELLLEEQVNVTEAALAVGYSSLSHFTKAFAGQFNCCPSDCRNPRGRAG